MTGTAHPPRRRADGPLRVGIVGAGDIAAYHLAAWQRAPRAECVAVCDVDAGRAGARAAAFGIDGVYTDAAAMLAAADIDILDIATWRDSHAALVRLGIAHGVAILCQKPLAPSLAEAEALVAEAEGRVRLMVNENRRFQPPFRRIGAWIQEGAVGTVRQVNMTMHRSGYIPGPDGRRASLDRSPRMGAESRLLIAETFIHQLDVLRWLVGPLRVVAARALRTEPDMPGETLAAIMLETMAGAPVILAGSFVAPGFGTVVSDRLELIGSRSSVVLDVDRLSMRGGAESEERFDMKAAYQACFDAAAAHFADCLWQGLPFESDPRDNLETLRLVEDAYRLSGLE